MQKEAFDFRSWLPSGSVFAVDPCFRHCFKLLKDLSFATKIHHFLMDGSQHTCLEANESSMVTKIRWVIEAVNGLLKKWKELEHVVPKSQIPNIVGYARIFYALFNALWPPQISENSDEQVITDRVLRLVRKICIMQERAAKEGWSKKRVIWKSLNDDAVSDFPTLTPDELMQLTLGTYQLKEVRSLNKCFYIVLFIFCLYCVLFVVFIHFKCFCVFVCSLYIVL